MWKVRPISFFVAQVVLLEKNIGLSINEGTPICFKALLTQTSKAKHVSHWTFTWLWRSHVFQLRNAPEFPKIPSFVASKTSSTSRSWFSKFSWHFSILFGGWSFWFKQKKMTTTYPRCPLNLLTFTGGCLVGASYVFLASVLKHKRSIIWSNFELIVVKSFSNWPSLWINLQESTVFFLCVFILTFFDFLDLWGFLLWFCLVRMICLLFLKSQSFNFVGDK